MKRTALVALALLAPALALAQRVDPRLLDARKVWESYDQLRSKSEADQATQYRNLKAVYAAFPLDGMSAADRLGRHAVELRCAYLEMPQVSMGAYEEGVRRTLSEFHNVIRAAKAATERTEGYEPLAIANGVNVAAPTPPIGLIIDVVQTGILMSIRFPTVARTYGAALSGILNDAIPLYGPDERGYLKAALANLVEIDGGNLAGSARLNAEIQRLESVLGGRLFSDADNAERLREEISGAAERWKLGLRTLGNKCNGLVLADLYADKLFAFARLTDSEKTRRLLLLASLHRLRDSLQETHAACSGPNNVALRNTVQQKLLDRLLDYGHADWVRAINSRSAEERTKTLAGLAGLLGEFVDDSSEHLQKDQQALIHAYLAQAYTLLAEDTRAMAHYEKAKYVLPIAELETIAKHRAAPANP